MDGAPFNGGSCVAVLHREGSGLKLKGCSDAVKGLKTVLGDALGVAMQVDKARRDDIARDIEHDATNQASSPHRSDAGPGDTHVPHLIGTRLGIDNAASREHKVVLRTPVHEMNYARCVSPTQGRQEHLLTSSGSRGRSAPPGLKVPSLAAC